MENFESLLAALYENPREVFAKHKSNLIHLIDSFAKLAKLSKAIQTEDHLELVNIFIKKFKRKFLYSPRNLQHLDFSLRELLYQVFKDEYESSAPDRKNVIYIGSPCEGLDIDIQIHICKLWLKQVLDPIIQPTTQISASDIPEQHIPYNDRVNLINKSDIFSWLYTPIINISPKACEFLLTEVNKTNICTNNIKPENIKQFLTLLMWVKDPRGPDNEKMNILFRAFVPTYITFKQVRDAAYSYFPSKISESRVLFFNKLRPSLPITIRSELEFELALKGINADAKEEMKLAIEVIKVNQRGINYLPYRLLENQEILEVFHELYPDAKLPEKSPPRDDGFVMELMSFS